MGDMQLVAPAQRLSRELNPPGEGETRKSRVVRGEGGVLKSRHVSHGGPSRAPGSPVFPR